MSRPPRFGEIAARLVPARAHWRNRGDLARETPPPGVRIEVPGPGQESVWAYPRPPRVDDVVPRIRVVFGGRTIAETTRGKRIVETAGAPVYYVPPEDVAAGVLRETGDWSFCEWKGAATTLDVVVGERTARAAAWTYREPFTDLEGPGDGGTHDYARIAGYVGFLAAKMDACYVGDERARPQPGGFYGGWVTGAIAGPIKGDPGSDSW